MKRYASIMAAFFKASFISDLEYRLNVVMKVFSDIIWYTTQIALFEALYRNVNQVSGWTIETSRVFMGVLFVTDSIWMLLFSENLDRLSDRVRKGELDLLLAKPVNSQFMLSFQKINTAYTINIAVTCCYLVWACLHLDPPVAWYRLSLLVILIPCALSISYGLRFFFSATALIFARAENINYVWYQIYRLGMRPEVMYPTWLRYVVLTIVPMGFLASVPTRILIGSAGPELLLVAVMIAAILIFISTRFWRFALRSYTSASS